MVALALFSCVFYSSVILNGTETTFSGYTKRISFYSSVILNGTETTNKSIADVKVFYSSVILNGTETYLTAT